MRHICCLVKHLRYAQVPNFNVVIFRQEHIDGLNVAVKNAVLVQVVDAKAHLDKEFPNFLFGQTSPHLALQQQAEVSVFAELHDNVDF